MNVDTMVSVDLFSMGKASSHPVRLSMMVRICLLPVVEVSHSVTKSTVILSSGCSSICHLQRVRLNLGLYPVTQCTVSYVFPDVLVHTPAVILAFYEAVCSSSSLVTKFVMYFNEHCVFPHFWNVKSQELLV